MPVILSIDEIRLCSSS